MALRMRLVGVTIFQVIKDFIHDNGPEWAASIAYYTLLSIFPLLLAAFGISTFFIPPSVAIGLAIRFLGQIFPSGAGEIIQVVQEAIKARNSISIISIILLLWSGKQVFGAVMKALNIAYTTGEDYTFARRILVQLLMALTLGALFLIVFILQFVVNLLFNQFQQAAIGQLLLPAVLQIVTGLLLLATYMLTFRLIPRCPVKWRSSFWGALVSTLLFLIARPLFTNYVTNFANYNLIYGSLAIVITLIVWSWVMALILLFGGEIAAHVQSIHLEGNSPEEVEKRHIRRSPTYKEVEGAELPAKEEEEKIAGKQYS